MSNNRIIMGSCQISLTYNLPEDLTTISFKTQNLHQPQIAHSQSRGNLEIKTINLHRERQWKICQRWFQQAKLFKRLIYKFNQKRLRVIIAMYYHKKTEAKKNSLIKGAYIILGTLEIIN